MCDGRSERMINELDKRVIRNIQGDLPLERRPFAAIAEKIGVSEKEVVARIRRLKEQGIIRRFGATLRHQEAGFSSNAMVAWLVPDDLVEKVANILVRFREVTHCYQRRPQEDWLYNLYTMVHGSNEGQCYQIAESMSRSTGIDEYVLLLSEEEFKKTSMEYF